MIVDKAIAQLFVLEEKYQSQSFADWKIPYNGKHVCSFQNDEPIKTTIKKV